MLGRVALGVLVLILMFAFATILNHVAGYPAIGGASIEILLKAVVGQLDAQKEKNNGRLRDILLGNQEDKKHDDSR